MIFGLFFAGTGSDRWTSESIHRDDYVLIIFTAEYYKDTLDNLRQGTKKMPIVMQMCNSIVLK
jgi:hypothetical protein